MATTYILVFLLGCGVGLVVGELARRYRQRSLARKLLQAIDAGEIGRQPAAGRASLADDPSDELN